MVGTASNTARRRMRIVLASFAAEFLSPGAVSPVMKPLLALIALAIAGCATSADCGSDRRPTGERDGRRGAGSQAERYAARCGVPVDAAAYDEGYRLGFSHRPIPNW